MKLTFISLFLFVLIFQSNYSSAQNLLDMQGWLPGQGNAGVFGAIGQVSENMREWGEGPGGQRAVLWKAQPDGNSDADGGWNTLTFPVNHAGMYRFSIWLKKTNSNDGYSYFGCQNVNTLNGNFHDNPYFFYGDLPELNKWYLLVGYVHGSGDVSMTNYGGIYDGTTGVKMLSCTDFKFGTDVTSSLLRSYLYYDPNVNDRQYFYAPRVDLVNGDEPSLQALLGSSLNANGDAYFTGKVGIGTTTPDEKLAVNGKIHAREIRVDMIGWPDYVFKKEYALSSLEQAEKYIKEKGYLPGMPSAKEVETNGVELGEMNKKLLQKIEELTLHLITQEKRINQFEKGKTEQDKTIKKLTTSLKKTKTKK